MSLALSDILAVKRPSSLISDGAYWQNLFVRAFAKVKDITGRWLEDEESDEWGDTWTLERADGSLVQVYDLQEPTGAVLAFADFTTLTVNGIAVLEADVTIGASRLILTAIGHVHAVYPGGYLAEAEPAAVIKSAVCLTMDILHQSESAQTSPDFKPVEEMLWPYTQTFFAGSSPHSPSDL